MRRRESLLALLAFSGSLATAQSDVAAVASMLNGAVVGSPIALDTLNGLLGGLGKNVQRLDAAAGRFNASTRALLEVLDRPAPPKQGRMA